MKTVKKKKTPKVRVGTLNIPLDSAKLPDGHSRAKIVAKQVHDADLAILACQELDRSYPGDTWHYARILLKELRKYDKTWKINKPTTPFNENVTYHRPGKAKHKRSLFDTILPSKAGGRHATRTTYTVGGKTLTIRNTHLVQGADNKASREQQAKALLRVCGKSTVIMGDLNQAEVPEAFRKSYVSAKDAAKSSNNVEAGTYAKWGTKKVSGKVLDHILVPKGWTVNGYNVIGVDGDRLVEPRASDHLLVIASISMGKV